MTVILRRLGVVSALLLVPFAIATMLGGWQDSPSLPGGAAVATIVVITLLVADVVLPVPSSAVLIAAGAALGPVAGPVAGTLGLIGGAVVGYLVGRRFPADPIDQHHDRARGLVRRWGPTAVVLTRPVPLLAESTAVVAGMTRMDPYHFVGAVVAGAIPTGVGLALVGNAGADALDGTSSTMVLAATAAVAGLAALVLRHRRPVSEGPAGTGRCGSGRTSP